MRKILVCEDDQVLNDNLTEYLSSLPDVEIDQAFNGEEGFQKLVGFKYDLVIMDHFMPVLTGGECIVKFYNEQRVGTATPWDVLFVIHSSCPSSLYEVLQSENILDKVTLSKVSKGSLSELKNELEYWGWL